MDRRKFLETTCRSGLGLIVGGLALNLLDVPSVKASSRRSTDQAGEGEEVRDIPLFFEDTSELAIVGGAYHLVIEDLQKDILVARVSEEQYVAVDTKCTHKGCDVAYDKSERHFACPCHGSLFGLDGKVKNGPAEIDLKSYRTEVTEFELIVKVPVPATVE